MKLSIRTPGVTEFEPLPPGKLPRLAWPTSRTDLFAQPGAYFARTRVNPRYGLPGWTRDGGHRFHRGCDIAPIEQIPAGREVEVLFSDAESGAEYPSMEPVWLPRDDVFAVLDGLVAEASDDEPGSDFGRFVVLRHAWPDGTSFHTLYGHLADVAVISGAHVSSGTRLGGMGASSRSEDARKWLAIAPHLHFEVIAGGGGAHDPVKFLRAGLHA